MAESNELKIVLTEETGGASSPPVSSGAAPSPVSALTPANAKALADAMSGKITPEQLDARLKGDYEPTAPAQTLSKQEERERRKQQREDERDRRDAARETARVEREEARRRREQQQDEWRERREREKANREDQRFQWEEDRERRKVEREEEAARKREDHERETQRRRDEADQREAERGAEKDRREVERQSGQYSAGRGRLNSMSDMYQRSDAKQTEVVANEDAEAKKQARIDAERYTRKRGGASELSEAYTSADERLGAAEITGTAEKFRTASGAAVQMAGGGIGSKVSGAVQLAGSGLLGEGAAALAGGPVGLAVAAAGIVADQAHELIDGLFSKASASIEKTAQGFEKLAGNDIKGLWNDAQEGVQGFMDAIGPAGWLVAGQMKVFQTAVNAATQVVDAFVQRGRQLEGFQGDLAGAGAQADVARLEADIREAQMTGEAVARMTDAQSSLDSLGREILLTVKTEVVGALAEVVEPLGEIAEEVRPFLRIINDGKRDVSVIAQFVRAVPAVTLFRVIARLLKILDSTGLKRWLGEDDEEVNSLLQDVFDAADTLLPPPVPKPKKVDPRAQAVGAPLWG